MKRSKKFRTKKKKPCIYAARSQGLYFFSLSQKTKIVWKKKTAIKITPTWANRQAERAAEMVLHWLAQKAPAPQSATIPLNNAQIRCNLALPAKHKNTDSAEHVNASTILAMLKKLTIINPLVYFPKNSSGVIPGKRRTSF